MTTTGTFSLKKQKEIFESRKRYEDNRRVSLTLTQAQYDAIRTALDMAIEMDEHIVKQRELSAKPLRHLIEAAKNSRERLQEFESVKSMLRGVAR